MPTASVSVVHVRTQRRVRWVRCGLAAIWLVSGLAKVTHPDHLAMASTAEAMHLHVGLLKTAVFSMASFEVALGLLLACRWRVDLCSRVSMLFAATLLVAWAVAEPLRGNCGCMGTLVKLGPSLKLGLILVLFAGSYWTALRTSRAVA